MLGRNRAHRAYSAFLAALILVIGSACDGVLASGDAAYARDARVIVSNEGSTPLLLVVSTRFGTTTDPLTGVQQVIVVAADTTPVNAASFDRTFDIYGADRFLAQLINPDSVRTATVQLRVQLDNREVYSQRATLRNASLQYLNFYRQ